MTDERIAKLPKWAQNHIGVLQRNLERARARLVVLTIAEDKPTNVQYDLYAHSRDPKSLPQNEAIRFVTGDSDEDFVDVRPDRDDPSRVIVRGGGPLVVQPTASNGLTIEIRKR